MLIVHHLGKSQSERIVWLCEELGIPYELKRYDRVSATNLAPPEYKALHPLGAAPVIFDGDVVLAESAAVVEYIIRKYGDNRLTVTPDHPDYADYLYWFHASNGNLQATMTRMMSVRRANPPEGMPVLVATQGRLNLALGLVEDRLGKSDYLVGPELTAADIMSVFSLTTMRHFLPLDLAPYPNIRAYVQRIRARPAYQAAMRKGDPDLPPLD